MKKLTLLLTLILTLALAGQGWTAGSQLNIVDYLPMRVFAADATYLYGIGPTTVDPLLNNERLSRTSSRTVDPTMVYDFDPGAVHGHNIDNIWAIGNGIVIVESASQLFKSIDSGSHFGANAPSFNDGNPVMNLTPTWCGALYHGLCVDTFNNQLLIGEYNTNAGRVPGGANDQVRIMRSTDQGSTWTQAVVWNQDGSNNNVRHVHAIRQDSYTGLIYICFGDALSAGIIRWDGVSAIANNQNVSTYPVNLTGSAHCITVDMLFTQNNLYTFTDMCAFVGAGNQTTTDQTGIWQFNKDLTGGVQLNHECDNYGGGNGGWYGLTTSSGAMIFEDSIQAGLTSASTPAVHTLITSIDGGATWHTTGQSCLTTGYSIGEVGLTEFNGEIYYVVGYNAGKNNSLQTAIFTVGGPWPATGTTPTTLHPVYWVNSSTGSDGAPVAYSFEAKGYRPSYPWATLNYAVGEYMSYGGRIIINAESDTLASSVVPSWTANSFPTLDTLVESTIEGAGRSLTSLSYTGHVFNFSSYNVMPLRLKKLTAAVSSGNASVIYNTGAQTAKISAEDCTLGSLVNTTNTSATVRSSTPVSLTRTTVNQGNLTTGNGIYMTTTTTLELYSSVVNGGYYPYTGIAAVTAYDDTFYNYGYGYDIAAGTLTVPIIKNCTFLGHAGSSWDIADFTSLTETDASIDYNCYAGNLYHIANSGGSHRVNGTPSFRNAAGGDFSLKYGSPGFGAGVSGLGVTADYNSLPIPLGGKINMGAYNNQYLGSPMGLGLGMGLGGFPGWQHRPTQ